MKKVRVEFEGQVFVGMLGADGDIALVEGGRILSPDEVDFLPPVERPGKVICVGLNYPPLDAGPDWNPPPYPILFHKAASALTGHGSAIILPEVSGRVLYEGELAVVVGERGIHRSSSHLVADSRPQPRRSQGSYGAPGRARHEDTDEGPCTRGGGALTGRHPAHARKGAC